MSLPYSIHYGAEEAQGTKISEQISKGVNLAGVTVFVYSDHFIIEPNTKITGLKSRLKINRDTCKIIQVGKSDDIVAPERKVNFTMFLGILQVLNLQFLVFIEFVKEPLLLQSHEIYEVADLAYVAVGNEKQYAKNARWPQVMNYLAYLKNTVMANNHYFSFTYDLSVSKIKYAEGYPKNFKFCWNASLAKNLYDLEEKEWMISLIQGFVGTFSLTIQDKNLTYFLISRRSWKNGGTRYNARGISNKGNVANFVQTQQIILIDKYCCSHVQIRGSVPAFWRQTGMAATVEFTNTRDETVSAFCKHFNKMKELYDRIMCVNLLAMNKAQEHQLTLYFEELIKSQSLKSVRYEYFDFHEACKNHKFQNANNLIFRLGTVNEFFKYYAEDMTNNKVLQTQVGVMRTNCLDCLDRTNFVQTKLALHTLEHILTDIGIDLQKRGLSSKSLLQAVDSPQCVDPFVVNLKNLWADNGDAISIHYTGTGSTHTNIIRAGKRDLKGSIEHTFKTLNRFYHQNVEDTYKQQVIDLLIGEHVETLNFMELQKRMASMAIRADSVDL